MEYLKNSGFVDILHTYKNIDGNWINASIESSTLVVTDKYDIIFVPMLAGDRSNNRLGYGSGFYDKFLTTQPQALKIGLCYSKNIADKIPAEPHDVKLDQIITEIN